MLGKFKTIAGKVAIFCLLALVSSCGTKSVLLYENEKPELNLEKFFSGNTVGWGVVQDRSGEILKRFKVDIKGSFSANEGKLVEDFEWSDGKRETRIWYLKKENDLTWTGEAENVIGVAFGQLSGNTLKWQYLYNLELENSLVQSISVNFEDWMYLLDENILLNQATFSKYGIRLGSVTITFTKSLP
ncbi:MAG: hypothetical protein CBC42_02805 [Betaproteobacteria bacterium TMED82]|nr:MAG: hypothetical protein CBC42_02805 [Betaproteobacteria bacterium TMED82]|tara:strand:+ start:8284 stop:8844 length:561 start_codon:yes stop_codon:yes gene_type:complete